MQHEQLNPSGSRGVLCRIYFEACYQMYISEYLKLVFIVFSMYVCIWIARLERSRFVSKAFLCCVVLVNCTLLDVCLYVSVNAFL